MYNNKFNGGAEADPAHHTHEIFNSYEIKYLLFKITIIPTRRINLNVHHRMIIEYNIELSSKDVDPKTGESNGPYNHIASDTIYYYYSIGETNGLKSSLWLPMLYLNTRSSIGETSTRQDFGINGVIKNNVFQCLDFEAIKQEILDQTHHDISTLDMDADRMASRYSHPHNGLKGVLNRVDNLFDLFMATNSYSITDFDETNNDDIFKLRPENANPPYLKGIMYLDDYYRKNTILALKNIRLQLDNILEITQLPIDVPRFLMAPQDFNNSLNIFVPGSNILSDTYKQKNEIYRQISQVFYQFIIDNLDPAIPGNLQLILKPPTQVTAYKNQGNLVNLIRQGWHIDVRKKYLKYKMKYLKLKQNKKY